MEIKACQDIDLPCDHSKGIFLDQVELSLFILLSCKNCEAGLVNKLSL